MRSSHVLVMLVCCMNFFNTLAHVNIESRYICATSLAFGTDCAMKCSIAGRTIEFDFPVTSVTKENYPAFTIQKTGNTTRFACVFNHCCLGKRGENVPLVNFVTDASTGDYVVKEDWAGIYKDNPTYSPSTAYFFVPTERQDFATSGVSKTTKHKSYLILWVVAILGSMLV